MKRLYAGIILKYVIYGSTVLFISRLLETTDSLDVLALRFLMSSIVFAVLIVTGVIRFRINFRNMKLLVLTSLFDPVLSFLFEIWGISMTSNITAAIIAAIAPILHIIAQRIVLKEKTNAFQSVCLCVGIAGVIYIVTKTTAAGGVDVPIGILFMLLSVLSGAFYSAFSRKTTASSFSSTELTCFSAFFGMAIFNGVNVVRHAVQGTLANYFVPLLSVENLIGFFFLGVISSVCTTWINNYALSKLAPIRISAFSGISTIVTILLGVLCNNEKLYLFHIVGTLMILCSILGVNYFAEQGGLRRSGKKISG